MKGDKGQGLEDKGRKSWKKEKGYEEKGNGLGDKH